MDTATRFQEEGQGHVFEYWSDLDEVQRSNLIAQAEEIDLQELKHLVGTLVKGEGEDGAIDFSLLKPFPFEPLPHDEESKARWRAAFERGEDALRNGKIAAFTVAGGQGTRLGYSGPKGTFPVTPIKKKPLFQVFAEKIQAARFDYDCDLPWYIMTSHINHEATESFFRENGYFGLEPGSVSFFRQGRMPAVDFDGKIILESKSSIAMSPDGHGGSLRALERSGALSDMERKGVEIISYFQVDNPLVQAIDPAFIGFHLAAESDMSSKMLPKAYEKEKLGHFCQLDSNLVVVEYSDMPDELTSRRDSNGELEFIAGSIAIHLISTSFVRKLTSTDSPIGLPFHKAEKKIACLSSSGETVKPDEPNGIKFEMFVFDSLPFAENPVVIETTRLGDFSPVKNAEGVDSPATSEADQLKLFAQWLNAVGYEVSCDENGLPERRIEISPLFATTEDQFLKRFGERSPSIPATGDIVIE